MPLRTRTDAKTTAALEKAADIAIGSASFTRTVAIRLLRDCAVRRKVRDNPSALILHRSIGRDEQSKSR